MPSSSALDRAVETGERTHATARCLRARAARTRRPHSKHRRAHRPPLAQVAQEKASPTQAQTELATENRLPRRLAGFGEQVAASLENLDTAGRRRLLRLFVDKVRVTAAGSRSATRSHSPTTHPTTPARTRTRAAGRVKRYAPAFSLREPQRRWLPAQGQRPRSPHRRNPRSSADRSPSPPSRGPQNAAHASVRRDTPDKPLKASIAAQASPTGSPFARRSLCL